MPRAKSPARSDANSTAPTKSSLNQGIYEGLGGFRLALRRFLASSEETLTAAGVTSQQYQAMLVIKTASEGHVLIRELAAQMLLPHNGAVQLVDRLSNAGLAVRLPPEGDKRTVVVGLTAKGEEMLEHLAKPHLAAILSNERLLIESLVRLRQMAIENNKT